MDKWSLIPGKNFEDQLYEAMQTAGSAILIATPDAIDSGWVKDEYSRFRARLRDNPEFKLIPIVLGTMPEFPFLQNIQSIDFRDATEAGYRRAFHKLICGLQEKAPGAGSFTDQLEIPDDFLDI